MRVEAWNAGEQSRRRRRCCPAAIDAVAEKDEVRARRAGACASSSIS
jgi:hypothetical protein